MYYIKVLTLSNINLCENVQSLIITSVYVQTIFSNMKINKAYKYYYYESLKVKFQFPRSTNIVPKPYTLRYHVFPGCHAPILVKLVAEDTVIGKDTSHYVVLVVPLNDRSIRGLIHRYIANRAALSVARIQAGLPGSVPHSHLEYAHKRA